ncbi:MAG: ABC transporter ATP-binding protein [Rhizobium sp.]
MRLMGLIPAGARPALLPFGLWLALATALRAGSALLLVPFLTALFAEPVTATSWLAAMAVTTATGWAVERRAGRLGFDLGLSVMESINERLIAVLLSIPLGWLTTLRQAEAKRALSGTAMELFSGFVNLSSQIGINLMLPGAIGLGLLLVAWPLGLMALVFWPILLVAMGIGGRLMRRAEADFAAAGRNVAERIDEFAHAQAVLRSAGRAGTGGPVAGAIEGQRRAAMRILWFSLPGTLVFSLVLQLVLIALFGTLGWMMWTDRIETVEAIALGTVILRYVEPIQSLATLFPALESLHGMAGRTLAVLDAPRLSFPAHPRTPVSFDVELDDVCFAPAGHDVLRGVSFTAPEGATTAIVGPSGAGKSTILSIVARFHEPDGGAVRVGSIDLREVEPNVLMEQLAIVFQTVQLFEGSIADNIRVALPDATDDAVIAAGRAAGVEEIAARLGGWDAPVGEGGQLLSGGERQRISIARALLKKTRILLLDEATSALDTINEAAIAQTLREFRDRTIIVIAHRLETIANADHVVFVEDGRVVEAGGLLELIQSEGRFSEWWQQRRAAGGWKFNAGIDR